MGGRSTGRRTKRRTRGTGRTGGSRRRGSGGRGEGRRGSRDVCLGGIRICEFSGFGGSEVEEGEGNSKEDISVGGIRNMKKEKKKNK